MEERLVAILSDYVELEPSEVTEDTDIRTDLGLDSLQLADIMTQIEKDFGIEISDRDASNIRTVGDVLEILGS